MNNLNLEIDDLIQSVSKDQWTTVDRSSQQSNWNHDSHEITQNTAVGTRKAASGSLRVCPWQNPDFLHLVLQPGSRYHTGLVFNYKDAKNFSLFAVNLYARLGSGHTLYVARVKNGDFDYLCREKYSSKTTPEAVLEIKPEEQGLSFYWNDQSVFYLQDERLTASFGLYSQQNDDARFTRLIARDFWADTKAGEREEGGWQIDAPGLMPQPSEDQNPYKDNKTNPKGLKDYMSLRPPSSRTEVEFNEVFTVPLDSFYNSLNEVIHSQLQGADGLSVNKSHLLDQRPRRWYKNLRDLDLGIQLLSGQMERKKSLADHYDQLLTTEFTKTSLDETAIEALEKSYADRMEEYAELRQKLEVKQNARDILVREIRTNGYQLESSDLHPEIQKKGFDFVLKKPVDTEQSFVPITASDKAFKTDGAWTKLEQRLSKSLFDTGIIQNTARPLYIAKQKTLVNRDSHTELLAKIDALEKDIPRVQKQIDQLTERNKKLYPEIDLWEKDLTELSKQPQAYRAYNSAEYPGVTQTSDPTGTKYAYMQTESEKLHNWISGLPAVDSPTKTSLTEYIRIFNKKAWVDPSIDYRREHYIPDNFVDSMSMHRLNKLILTAYKFHIPGKKLKSFFHYHAGVILPDKSRHYSRGIDLAMEYKIGYRAYLFSTATKPHTYDIGKFFAQARIFCDHTIRKLKNERESNQRDINKLTTEKALKMAELKDLKDNGLARARKEFFTFWNDPENSLLQEMTYMLIYPDSDPLTDFLVEQESRLENKQQVRTYYYVPTENGYYNQYGQSLRDFVDSDALSEQPNISLFPVLDDEGNFSGEVIRAVRNPKKSDTKPHLPVIKFIETYQILIHWQGFGLGELSHAINLFPGESKELVVEKKTKITSKTQESRKEGEETKQNVKSSFEDNLQDTFSEQDKAQVKSQDKQSSSGSRSGEDASSSSRESSSSASVSANVSAGWGWGSASVSASASRSSKSTSASSSKRAFSAAQSREGLRASDQSKDVLRKNVRNSVRKVANDTSKNNKVEFSSVSSEEFQEDVSNKELVKLENPNVGRTVNYNFFQVQNHYGTSLILNDVKIVINTGQEIIKGTGIQDLRVFELEEFGKIYAQSGGSDHDKVVSSIIARQVLKHYANFYPGITQGNGCIQPVAGKAPNPKLIEVLTYSDEELNRFTDSTDLLEKIQNALEELKSVPFTFQEKVIEEETTMAVNTGAYHMESSVGRIPATEDYLEEHRKLDTQMKQAQLDRQLAQIEAGVHFPDLPDELNTLVLGADSRILLGDHGLRQNQNQGERLNEGEESEESTEL